MSATVQQSYKYISTWIQITEEHYELCKMACESMVCKYMLCALSNLISTSQSYCKRAKRLGRIFIESTKRN